MFYGADHYSRAQGAFIWLIVAAVLAVVGGLVVHFTFLNRKNNERFKGFLGWTYDFLTFKKLMLDDILRILYLISTIFVTLASFAMGSVINFILTLLVGNIVVRITYEFVLMLLLVCRNTTEINSKLARKEIKEEAPKNEVAKEEVKQ